MKREWPPLTTLAIEKQPAKLTRLNLPSDNEQTNALDCGHRFHNSERTSQSWHIQRNGREFRQFQPSYNRHK